MASSTFRKSLLFSLRRNGKACKKSLTAQSEYSTALHGLTGKSMQTKSVPGLKWELCAAVCLTRLPIISPKLTDLEKEYMQMLDAQELERSILSEWEVEKIRQANVIKAIEIGERNTEDMDFKITHQDREDEWEMKSKGFEFPEDDSGHDGDVTNLQRVIRQPLTYIIQKKLGNDSIWMLPTAAIKNGETMRECAEQAISLHCQKRFQGTILSNAPSGYYKYKFPKEVRLKNADDYVGAKVFIYTALLKSTSTPLLGEVENELAVDKNGESDILGYAWASKDELPVYLKPKYFAAVEKILM